MSVQVRRRREAASFLASFTGAQAELIVDITNNRVQVHDGVTPGGWPAAKLGEVVLASQIGTANGVAALDTAGHIPVSQIPPAIASPLVYQGTWNAATNIPALASGVGTKSYAYKVAIAGPTAIDGWSNWEVGDWIIFDGTAWDRIASAEHLVSGDITDSTSIGRTILTAVSAAAIRSAAGTAASGANSDITSLAALVTPLSVAQGGTGAGALTGILKGAGISGVTAAVAGTDYLAPNGSAASLAGLTSAQVTAALAYNPAHSGANSDITSLAGLTAPLSVAQGGTGGATITTARANLAAAASGANADITSLSTLTSVNGAQLAGLRNRLINGNFVINQRVYSSGTALNAGIYGFDRWKAGANGATVSYSTATPDITITISAGSLLQIIEAANIEGGTYTLSWTGTATARVYQGTAASYSANGINSITVTGLASGTNTTIEFSAGTCGKTQFEPGSIATVFERRPLGMELGLCQRYFFTTYFNPPGIGSQDGYGPQIYAQVASSSSYLSVSYFTPVPARASPTVSLYSARTGTVNKFWAQNAAADLSAAVFNISAQCLNVGLAGPAISAGEVVKFHLTGSAEL